MNFFFFLKQFLSNGAPQNKFVVKLTNQQIKWVVDQVVNYNISTRRIAQQCSVSQRRIQQLVKAYKSTGKYPQSRPCGRPRTHLTDKQKEIIEKAYNESSLGARLLRDHIRKYYNVCIPQNKIHEYLLKRGYTHPNLKKQRERRHREKHSLSLIHIGWLQCIGEKVIVCLDDASRYVLALGEFDEVTSKDIIGILTKAEAMAEALCSTIVAVKTAGDPHFFHKKEEEKSCESVLGEYLQKKKINHITSSDVQTGKLKRWIRVYKRYRKKFSTTEQFVSWYNKRPHGALDLEKGVTPEEAFISKLSQQSLYGMFLERIENRGI